MDVRRRKSDRLAPLACRAGEEFGFGEHRGESTMGAPRIRRIATAFSSCSSTHKSFLAQPVLCREAGAQFGRDVGMWNPQFHSLAKLFDGFFGVAAVGVVRCQAIVRRGV